MPNLIYLYGPPGAGKSTIGKILAEKLDLAFTDLDFEIEHKTGKSISEIFEEHGEPGFRKIESQQLVFASHNNKQVIALGGGSLLNPQNRSLAEKTGLIICLSGDFETLLRHTSLSPDKRPLLSDNRSTRLAKLLERRQDHYSSFPNQLDIFNRTLDQVVWDCQVLAGRFLLKKMEHPYSVTIKDGLLNEIDVWLSTGVKTTDVYIITDSNVAPNYVTPVKNLLNHVFSKTVAVCTIQAGESSKSLKSVTSIWNFLVDSGASRQSMIVALGGGVIGDLAGFAAATYMRGIQWINIPTTILAMVDAGIGGKTGVNLPKGKNLVGAFHPPQSVFMDPAVLRTLSRREFSSGMAEAIKHALIGEMELLSLCRSGQQSVSSNLEKVISRGASVKIRIVEADPFESDLRQSLNLGHTIGHALEKASEFQLTHGESIAIGIVAETFFAEKIGIARPGLHQEIAEILRLFELPVQFPDNILPQTIIKFTKVDKKMSAGNLRFPLLRDFADVQLNIEIPDLEQLISEFRKIRL